MGRKRKVEQAESSDSLKDLIRATLLEVLSEVKNVPTPTTHEPAVVIDSETFKVNKPTNGIKKRYNDNGQEEGSYGRREPAKFTGNTFVDDGTISSEERKETEAMANKLSQGEIRRRERRPPAKTTKIHCARCDAEFQVYAASLASKYYICNSCARKSHS